MIGQTKDKFEPSPEGTLVYADSFDIAASKLTKFLLEKIESGTFNKNQENIIHLNTDISQ